MKPTNAKVGLSAAVRPWPRPTEPTSIGPPPKRPISRISSPVRKRSHCVCPSGCSTSSRPGPTSAGSPTKPPQGNPRQRVEYLTHQRPLIPPADIIGRAPISETAAGRPRAFGAQTAGRFLASGAFGDIALPSESYYHHSKSPELSSPQVGSTKNRGSSPRANRHRQE
jgi:hypothetical protein